MPILRLTKTDFNVAVTTNSDMLLVFTGFDGQALRFNWTGRAGTIPLDAIAKAINPDNRNRMMRSITIATDAATDNFWTPGDRSIILTSRLGARSAGVALQNAVFRFPLASPYDRISFLVNAKTAEYSIDVLINTTDEGDFDFPEVPVT